MRNIFFHSLLNLNGQVRSFSTASNKATAGSNGGILNSIFTTLSNSGVGKQFELDKEKYIWGAPTNMINHENVITRWKVFSDAEYGGTSKCSYKITNNNSDGSSILTFQGRINFDENSPIRHTSKGGYCAITGYSDSSVDLMDFEGVEVLLRTSKPCNFLVSLKPYSMMQEDLYQVIVQTTSSSWKRFHLPFHMFT
jgi:hypothetical protein